jgi:PBSX family phage terminase large subunit
VIKINDKYKSLFEQPKGVRYYIITGGRGSSKSFTATIWANLSILASTSKILFTRYTMTSAHISIIPEFVEKMELLNIENQFKVTKSEIVSNAGGEILFRGIKTSSGQQTANLKSLSGVNIWILDEAEELHDEKVFDKINLSIRHTEKQNIVVLILNPTLKEHWIYKRFFEQNNVPDGFNGIKGDTCYIHTSYLDNIENLSESFIEEVKRIQINNPTKYLNEILGGWLDSYEGVLFSKDTLNLTDSIDLSKVEHYLAYIDVATSKGGDYHSCLIGAIINKKLYIVDCVFTNEEAQVNVQKTALLLNKYNPEFCRIESNGAGALYKHMLEPNVNETKLLNVHSTQNKQTRIFQGSGWIKDNCVFLNNSVVGSEYHNFFRQFTTYLMDGSSKNDDAPDSVHGLSSMARSFYKDSFND